MNVDSSTAVEIVQGILTRQEAEPWRPVSERAEEIVAALDEAAHQKFVRERTGTWLTPQPEHIIPRVPRLTLEPMPDSELVEDLPLVYEFYEGRGSFIRRRRSGL